MSSRSLHHWRRVIMSLEAQIWSSASLVTPSLGPSTLPPALSSFGTAHLHWALVSFQPCNESQAYYAHKLNWAVSSYAKSVQVNPVSAILTWSTSSGFGYKAGEQPWTDSLARSVIQLCLPDSTSIQEAPNQQRSRQVLQPKQAWQISSLRVSSIV